MGALTREGKLTRATKAPEQQGKARRGEARRGKARRGKARQGEARRGEPKRSEVKGGQRMQRQMTAGNGRQSTVR